MNLRRLSILIATISLLIGAANAQPIDTFNVTLTPANGTVADRFTLRFELITEPDSNVRWPAIHDDDLPDLRVVDARYPPLSFAGPDRVRLIRTYTLEPDLPGDRVIPPFELLITPPDGDQRAVISEPLGLEITSLLDPTAEITELAPARSVVPFEPEPEDGAPVWVIVLVASGAGALASGGVGLFLRGRKTSAQDAPRSAAARRDQLHEQLRAELARPTPDVDGCLAMIDGIVRLHVESVTETDRSQDTNHDLARLIRDGSIMLPPDHAGTLTSVLEDLDAARFSGTAPNSAFVRQRLAALTPIVVPHTGAQHTSPGPEVAP